MKNVTWMSLLVGLLGAAVVFAQEPPPRDSHQPARPADVGRNLELQNRELEVQAHADNVKFQREMKRLELEQRRARLQQEQRAWGERPQMSPPMRQPMRTPMRCGRFVALHVFFAICAVVHLLLAVWVYQDIRKRNAGSGIWIVVTLLTGLFGAAVYALARLGEKQAAPPA
jgi:hypothetical protein